MRSFYCSSRRAYSIMPKLHMTGNNKTLLPGKCYFEKYKKIFVFTDDLRNYSN